jgi:hypothetical protein
VLDVVRSEGVKVRRRGIHQVGDGHGSLGGPGRWYLNAVRAATEIATLDTVDDQLSLFGAKWLERKNSGIRDNPRLVSRCLSGRSARMNNRAQPAPEVDDTSRGCWSELSPTDERRAHHVVVPPAAEFVWQFVCQTEVV